MYCYMKSHHFKRLKGYRHQNCGKTRNIRIKRYMTLVHLGLFKIWKQSYRLTFVTFMTFQIRSQSQLSVSHPLTCDILSF